MTPYPRELFRMRRTLRDDLRGYQGAVVHMAERVAMRVAAERGHTTLHGYHAALRFAKHATARELPPRGAA